MEKAKKYDDLLMEAFLFDEDDLEANQGGAFSARQMAELKETRKTERFWLIFWSLFGAVIVGFILMIGLRTPVGMCALPAGLMGLCAVFFSYRRSIYPLSQDLRETRVASVEGRIQLSLKAERSKIRYFMDVGGIRLPIKKTAFLSLKNRDPYSVYYAPHSTRILSVEWLREDNPFVDDARDGDDVEMNDAASDQPSKRYSL